MTRLTLTLDLPNDLAREAQAKGLLRENNLVGLIRAEVKRRKAIEGVERHFDAVGHDSQPAMSLKDTRRK